MRYLTYRPDIDGMRAIAVAIVVAFHAGVPGFGGGFVGVDVFFVVSGFLITGLLVDELRATGTVSLSRFYARRVRRLLPALALVLAATLALGSVLLLPAAGEQQDLAKSALAAALSASNIFFWITSNYFSPQADLRVLLHTWSLSVEEQYYLVWPSLLIGLMLLARKRWSVFLRVLITALGVVGIATFAWGVHTTRTNPTGAFFLMPMRAWEFALGGALMLAAPTIAHWPAFVRALSFLAGIALIGTATTMLDNTVAYPGTAVLLPTLGTTALIASGCGSTSAPLQGWLSSPGMVTIGRLSYSWYLWHWPLLSLARVYDLGERNLPRDVTLALISLGLAWLTYRWVEMPIRTQRYRGFHGTRATLLSGAAMSAAVMGCALGLGLMAQYYYAHPTDRQEKLTADAVKDLPRSTTACLELQHSKFATLAHDRRCLTEPSKPVDLVLWGDSHANHWFPLMHRASRELQVNVEEFARAACPPLLGVMPFFEGAADHNCEHFNQAVIAEIEQLARTGTLKGVVIAGRWPAYLGRPSPDGSLMATLSYGDGPLDPQESARALRAGLQATLERLERAGLRAVVVGATPEFQHPVPQCLLRRPLQECSMPRPAVDARRGDAMQVVANTVASNGGAHLFDPLGFFCDERFCYPKHGETVMFSDPQHLTAAGSPLLEPAMLDDLRWVLGRGHGLGPRAHASL